MPLWIVILFLGAGGSGFLFLKARQTEAVMVKKKIKQGSKSVRQAAKRATKPVEVPLRVPEAKHSISISEDRPSKIVREVEEIMKRKEV